ncbi:MAG: PqiC family protein [Planctomycetota bacterium]|jgi:uncharacterized protein|nr:PqiC family protein [Planctomycetota bacterium]
MQRDAAPLSLRLFASALCVLLPSMLLAGCGSTPNSRFYVLTPTAPAAIATGSPSMRVGLEPVMLPDAYNRPQMLMTVAPNQRILWEFDRWAGSLADNMTRVVGLDLEARLGPTSVYAQPGFHMPTLDYTVGVEILELEMSPDGQCTMTARFHIADKQRQWIASHQVDINPTNPSSHPSGPAGVATSMSAGLDTISQSIADALTRANASKATAVRQTK